METNPNFTYLCDNFENQTMLLLQGGTRSGKTYATCYFIIDYCLRFQGMEIDICRDTFTALKSTAWKDFQDILIACNIYNDKYHNKTDKTYELNKNIISYYGADNPDKIHGRSRDILWINEAHQFPSETIDQLFPRTRYKIIADYNPALGMQHWLDTYIAKYPPLITTYKDNPYLTDIQIADIESRKNNAYWWKIYGMGERTSRQGAIFENWQVGDFDTSLPYCYGQDYGFTIDPTTLIKVAVDTKRKIMYADELLYSKESMGTEAIYKANMTLIYSSKDLIVADSAEMRLISDLYNKGLNIVPCKKKPGSVQAGITAMQDYKIIITPKSHNLKTELSNYVWNDKKSGIPIDSFNHLIDAMRYAFERMTLEPKIKSSLTQPATVDKYKL
jgi:PBSX family phage terminase large subunit